jgi:gliding motility-associated-like protein
MHDCLFRYIKKCGATFSLLILTITSVFAQLKQNTLPIQHPNLTSFSNPSQHGLKGTAVEMAQKMVEVVEKRTANSRYFRDKDSAGKFYSIQSLGTINYYKNGAWQVIDTKLRSNKNGLITADNQENPVGFDTKKQASFIVNKNQPIYFNQWELYGEQNGKHTLLATANWQHYSAGDDGLYITQIFPGIDAEMLVQRGAIKTNFIVGKNEFPQYDQLIFKDRFNDANRTGRFSQKTLSVQTQPIEYVSNNSKLIVEPAYLYSEGKMDETYSVLSSATSANEFSFAVPANYLFKYLPNGRVIIDPLVSSTGSLDTLDITGSRNCGSESNTCEYTLNVNTPAKTTLTSVSWKFGYFATKDMTEGWFEITSGSCRTGFYTVENNTSPTQKVPGTVSTRGAWIQSTSLLSCMPAPSCNAVSVPFKLRFYNTNCTAALVCSKEFIKASEPLQIMIEGHTLETISTTASATDICAGTPSTLTTVGRYGVPPYTYTWSNGAGSSNTASVSPTATTTYTATITDQCANTSTGTATVAIKPSPVISAATSNSPVCEGSILQINTPDIAGASFAWTGPNGFTSTTANNSINNTTIAAAGVYTVIATQNGCASKPVSVTATVDAIAAPTVNITTSNTTICAGTNATFTASASNAGSAPSYQWQVNGANVGTNNDTFSSSSLANGSVVSCIVTSNAVCSTTPTATSDQIIMVVNAIVTPTVTIAASSTTICAGNPVTFTATTTNGGNTPTFQWKLNGANVGTNSNQFNSSALVNGDVISCEITGNAPCSVNPTATSNNITLIVNPLLVSTIKITASDTAVCTNTSVSFLAATTNAGAQPVYQWKVNGINVGGNSNSYSSNSLAKNDQVSCQLTSSVGCPSVPTVLSNIIAMDVSDPITPSIQINTADTNVCLGTSTLFTAIITNGGNLPKYQWLLNGTNVGTNSATYTNASLKTGDKISCILTSNATCSTSPTAVSNILTIKVNTEVLPTISIVADTTETCFGLPVTFTASTTNEGNSPVFGWHINGLNTSGDSKVFTTSDLTDGASVVAILFPQGIGCLATNTIVSNAIKIKINPVPVVNAGNDTMIFRGNGFRLNGQASGDITSYEWTPPTYLSSTTIRNPSTFPQTTITYTLKATGAGNCTASDTIRIKVLTKIEVPNAFSPNGDGINDTWNITGLAEYDGATLEVFDRYGQPILKSIGYNKPWDGTKNGKPLPVATYYYIITPQNGLQPTTGSVTIIR